MPQFTPSEIDIRHLSIIRENVQESIRSWGEDFDSEGKTLLDVAPQAHKGAREFWSRVVIQTLDINPDGEADFTADICAHTGIPSGTFDFILCTEVLEHTLQPFHAVAEMHRILKTGGWLMLSVPFNFRIHGPLPDCWRFTEHGLRALLNGLFSHVQINEKATDDRPLMPVHYTVLARKT